MRHANIIAVVFLITILLSVGCGAKEYTKLFVRKNESILKSKLKSVTDYLADKKQYTFVIRELTSREVKRKYARSHLGIIWSVLNPLLMMIVMSMVFSGSVKKFVSLVKSGSFLVRIKI